MGEREDRNLDAHTGHRNEDRWLDLRVIYCLYY